MNHDQVRVSRPSQNKVILTTDYQGASLVIYIIEKAIKEDLLLAQDIADLKCILTAYNMQGVRS